MSDPRARRRVFHNAVLWSAPYMLGRVAAYKLAFFEEWRPNEFDALLLVLAILYCFFVGLYSFARSSYGVERAHAVLKICIFLLLPSTLPAFAVLLNFAPVIRRSGAAYAMLSVDLCIHVALGLTMLALVKHRNVKVRFQG